MSFTKKALYGVTIALLQLPWIALPTQAARPTAQRDYSQYASNSYTAMQRYLYSDNSLYQPNYPYQGGNKYSYEWPFTQAMAATSDINGMPSSSSKYSSAVTDRETGLSQYWDSAPSFGVPGYDSYVVPPLGNGGSKFYDDNAWAGLNLVRTYETTGDTAALTQAENVFNFVTSGWDNDSSSCNPGGIFWVQQTPTETVHDRNTVSNAPNAELAFRLYQITGNQTYYDWGMQMYSWTKTNMRDSADGLYWDHVRADCSIDTTKWSYNQGAMIGANVLLYQITNDPTYLQEAETLANAALSYYNSVGYFSQDPAFNAIFFRNLLFLSSVSQNTTLKQNITTAMQNYGNQVWDNTQIHQKTNLFYFQSGYADLLQQAAMVEIYALLTWDPTNYAQAL